MATVIRRLRHWKQRYAPNAAFIWRRRLLFNGTLYEPGDQIPAELVANKSKLRRFWEGQIIELAEFEAPAHKAPEPEPPEPPAATVTVADVVVTVADATVTVADVPVTVADVVATVADATVTVADVPVTVADVVATVADTAPWTEIEPVRVNVSKPKSSSWYTVTTPDGKEHRANGPKNLEKLLVELNAVRE